MYLFIHQYHSALIIKALYIALKSGSMSPICTLMSKYHDKSCILLFVSH